MYLLNISFESTYMNEKYRNCDFNNNKTNKSSNNNLDECYAYRCLIITRTIKMIHTWVDELHNPSKRNSKQILKNVTY